MKRNLIVFFTLFLFVLPTADAGAWPWKRTAKIPNEVLVDREGARDNDREGARDNDRESAREREGEVREKPQRRTAPLPTERKAQDDKPADHPSKDKTKPIKPGPPVEKKLKKAKSKVFDLRTLPSTRPKQRERPEREGPEFDPVTVETTGKNAPGMSVDGKFGPPVVQAAAPAPLIDFDGLDRENWGAGSPPDTTGDVGPDYYIQAVNTSVGIFQKSDGFRVAAFTFDTLMSQGNFGNLCDTDNFGDPVVLYDTFEDRWILSDFAFVLDGGGNINPPVAYQCFAVSMNGDPVSGGWNFYSIEVTDGLHDYEKLGVWTDGIYMSANMFGFAAGASFQGSRAWAINKAQMYAGSPTVQIVQFDIGPGDFTVVPSNARLQTGTPPAGRPNYFISTSNFLNAVGVYKFHVDWNSITLSTFTGPDLPLAGTSWPNASVPNAPQSGTATLIDSLGIRAMVQNQYTNLGGNESLWIPHSVRRGNTTGFAAPRWYQVNITGGTVAANLPQAATWDPDAANVMYRFVPSLAVDRTGNLALAYTTSSSTTFPSIKYAGRLASDPVNTFSQTEQTLFAGTASQTGSTRWGDYSSVMLDPDGCTFWITHQYANPASQDFDKRWKTRIGSFRYPECTFVGAGGTISGTVTATAGGTPLGGATVTLGARSTTTDGSGAYSFADVPAGTYPLMTASQPGYVTGSASSIAVTDGGTTTQNFSLATAPTGGCPVDTAQADFQTGVGTAVDLVTSPGNVTLANPPVLDQQNTTLGTQGAGFNTATWLGQTFTAAVTGPVTKVDINFFSLNCGAVTMPNLTVSIRNAAANLPTGADLATATIPGFCNGAGGYYTATFATPATLTAGTQYALVWRAAAAIPGGAPAPGYFGTVSAASGLTTVQNPYAGGRRASSANSGSTWAGAAGNANNDHGFRIYVDQGYGTSGTLVSSTKDSNPAAGMTAIWSTLTWTATTPANTTVRFQVAGSNSINGPFAFRGPDGTAATYFTTSGASLAQFYGLRYLQYKAYLSTTNTAVTPTLHDVQVCYTTADCSGAVATITPGAAQACTSSTGNTASGPAGAASYSWSITNGTIVGSTTSQSITYTAGVSGTVDLSLSLIDANGCQASSSTSVPIVVVPTPIVNAGGPTTFCSGGSVTLTSSAATGNQWSLDGTPIGGATGQQYVATAAGDYTVVVTVTTCESNPSTATTVSVTPLPATPSITPDGPTTFCTGGSVTLTSSSASGNQWYLGGNPIGGATAQQYVATGSGDYTVIVTTLGCSSSASAATTVTLNTTPSTPTITPGGPTTFCTGGSVTLTSSSATGNQWYLGGNPIGGATAQQYVANANGNYTVVVTASGCDSAPSSAVGVTVNPTPSTPTITPGGPTTFCTGGSVTLTSSSASGNQWYLDGNPIGGATAQQYVATANGGYTVVATASSCPSSASAATTVTVNQIPATPGITPGGPTTFCAGGSVTLTSSSESGNQWFLGGNPIGGATASQYVATAAGNYTVVTSIGGCASSPSSATTVTVNSTATPSITPGGPTTFCTGGSVTLTSSSASGNQWYLDGNLIGGATAQQYVATANGDYTVVATANSCPSSASAATTVTVNSIPATPSVTPGGPTTFCAGGSVTLTSSSESGNQWFLGGNPIGGATAAQYVATAAGSYTVVTTNGGCSSASSSATVVTVNPAPATPTIGAGGPTTFCTGGSVTLTSSSATGNQWYLGGNPIGGATAQQYVANAAGSYTVVVTASGCNSAASAPTVVTVNPIPSTPTINAGGPTTFCTGGSVTLTSSSATGNQWFLGGNPIGGATAQQYVANANGNYTVVVTTSGCSSAPSSATTVTATPLPATPTITPGGPTSFCTGGSVTLTSSSASGNQWLLNGNPIGGATAQQYVASATGDYSVSVTSSGCSSTSAATTVTVNPIPDATITTAASTLAGSTGNTASVASAGVGAGYVWVVGNGTITGGQGTASLTFTAGAAGTLTVSVTVTSGASCSDADSVSVNVGTPAVTVTSVTPNSGTNLGGTAVTIAGSGFASGAGVTFGGTAATAVVVVSGTQITALTPAHAAGAVNVVVTNTDSGSGTLTNGYLYKQLIFDPNGDNTIDPSDIFYLVAYLFTGGPAPAGVAGMPSGDANGDGVVDPADIFFVVNYLFGNGPAPASSRPGTVATASVREPLTGAVSLGNAVRRNGRWFVPVIVTTGSGNAGALSLRVTTAGTGNVAIRHIEGLTPSFEVSRRTDDALSYLIALPNGIRSGVIAEIEVERVSGLRLQIDPKLTMLVGADGTGKATAAEGTLRLTNQQ